MIDDDPHEELMNVMNQQRKSRRALAEMIEEVDRRKLWWKLGYSSLYKYCENSLKIPPHDVDELREEFL